MSIAGCVATMLLIGIVEAADPPPPKRKPSALDVMPDVRKGDFDQMLERRQIRVAVPYSRSLFFNDGGKVSYGFPEQAANAAARQLRMADFLKSPYLMVIADGVLTAFPVANIKAIQMAVDAKMVEEAKLPAHVIRGATVTRGDL